MSLSGQLSAIIFLSLLFSLPLIADPDGDLTQGRLGFAEVAFGPGRLLVPLALVLLLRAAGSREMLPHSGPKQVLPPVAVPEGGLRRIKAGLRARLTVSADEWFDRFTQQDAVGARPRPRATPG